jgi:hypothetical protein
VWFRRGRLLIVSPVRGHHRRYQAETPLIPLSRFAEPALNSNEKSRLTRLTEILATTPVITNLLNDPEVIS